MEPSLLLVKLQKEFEATGCSFYMHCIVLQYSETYDWRLAVPNMEKRDSYFTRLKWRIELTHHTEQEKVCHEQRSRSLITTDCMSALRKDACSHCSLFMRR